MGCQEWSLITACPRRAVVVCYAAGQTRDSSQGIFFSELVYLSLEALLLKFAILDLLLYNLVIRSIQAFSPRRLEVVTLSWQVSFFFVIALLSFFFFSFKVFAWCHSKKAIYYDLYFILYQSSWMKFDVSITVIEYFRIFLFYIFLVKYIRRRSF